MHRIKRIVDVIHFDLLDTFHVPSKVGVVIEEIQSIQTNMCLGEIT